MEDTIVAISTSLGVGAISIVRVSGKEAFNIVDKIVKNKNIQERQANTIEYNKIIYKNEVIDEVLISKFISPNTYTGEDLIEINCHGGIAPTEKILQTLLEEGCRLANPGEFTERRFLNGKIDLLQAEGIMDLINSKNELTRKMAINQTDGKTSDMIRKLRQEFLEILANINVNIDYPEYEDIEVLTINDIKNKIGDLEAKTTKIIEESKNAKLIKEGINTVIIGRPNVGKSSLLNKLIKEDKAIVTEIAGTTRDIVEGQINLDGLTLNIIDTAGIRQTDDIVESIGVQKSIEMIDKAELIIYMLNNNEIITKEDKEILDKLNEKNYIIVINKVDLEKKIDISQLNKDKIIFMSTQQNIGLENLIDLIKKMYSLEKIKQSDPTYITNARCQAILNEIIESIQDVKNSVENNMPIDMLEIDINKIWQLLGKIIGEAYEDELINQLFSQFCLGK